MIDTPNVINLENCRWGCHHRLSRKKDNNSFNIIIRHQTLDKEFMCLQGCANDIRWTAFCNGEDSEVRTKACSYSFS